MKKELYFKPTLKVLAVKEEELMVNTSPTEIDDTFEEGAKEGNFFGDESLPHTKNVWDEEF